MQVINLKGRSSKQLNDNEIYIGRNVFMGGWKMCKSKWANPFPVNNRTREQSLAKYEDYIRNSDLMNALPELKDKILACWCYPEKCHGNI